MVAGREPDRVHPARRRHLRDAGAGRGPAACLAIEGRYQRRSRVVAGSGGSGNSSLWRVARDGGKPTRFPAPTMVSAQPSVARQSGRMIYVTTRIETKIFKMPLGAHAGAASPLIESDGDQRDLGVA